MVKGTDAVARKTFLFMKQSASNFNKRRNTSWEPDFSPSTFFFSKNSHNFFSYKTVIWGNYQTISPPTTFKMIDYIFLHFIPHLSLWQPLKTFFDVQLSLSVSLFFSFFKSITIWPVLYHKGTNCWRLWMNTPRIIFFLSNLCRTLLKFI